MLLFLLLYISYDWAHVRVGLHRLIGFTLGGFLIYPKAKIIVYKLQDCAKGHLVISINYSFLLSLMVYRATKLIKTRALSLEIRGLMSLSLLFTPDDWTKGWCPPWGHQQSSILKKLWDHRIIVHTLGDWCWDAFNIPIKLCSYGWFPPLVTVY